eukprot:gnl/TRDRNA2_/TRDRNA2_65808_c0_seq1.p1 gnl/TRDRNA2_/TRDRNA2_65808_c0~~gnl/TRDRNA2_/TRDRNA2_65808_c0_seq1.p1  ORF type:complete len:408 (-),score=51.94 gnl/TRDRNA2_/TRDRNA2_65808_c0_seq1:150-1373(-)
MRMVMLTWLLLAHGSTVFGSSATTACPASRDADDASLMRIPHTPSAKVERSAQGKWPMATPGPLALFSNNNNVDDENSLVLKAQARACLCSLLSYRGCQAPGVYSSDSDFGCHWTHDSNAKPVCGGYGFTCNCSAFDAYRPSIPTTSGHAYELSGCEQMPGCGRKGEYRLCKPEDELPGVVSGSCYHITCINVMPVWEDIQAAMTWMYAENGNLAMQRRIYKAVVDASQIPNRVNEQLIWNDREGVWQDRAENTGRKAMDAQEQSFGADVTWLPSEASASSTSKSGADSEIAALDESSVVDALEMKMEAESKKMSSRTTTAPKPFPHNQPAHVSSPAHGHAPAANPEPHSHMVPQAGAVFKAEDVVSSSVESLERKLEEEMTRSMRRAAPKPATKDNRGSAKRLHAS